ncbi:MAG: 5'-methylthioadenosine/S-adenosylhomocysteine nucleosidase family protein [Agriterribacter sp.]
MTIFPDIKILLQSNPLYVFALPSEAAQEFEDCNVLITGIGKVNAAYELTKRIAQNKPSCIINLGSAGSNAFKRGEVVCCTQFVQRDMDVRGLGFRLYETPLSGLEPVLEYGIKFPGLQEGLCGTGDSFEMAHSGTDYTIVDMEAYAHALIAMQEQIPFLCLKYISDGADGMAADDWTTQVHNAAAAFKKILTQIA